MTTPPTPAARSNDYKRLTAHLVRIEQKLDTVPNAAARSLAPSYKHGGSA